MWEEIISKNVFFSLFAKSTIVLTCSIAKSLRPCISSSSFRISSCNIDFSTFKDDIWVCKSEFFCCSLLFSSVSLCTFSDSVSPGNGSGTGSGSGNLIGSGSGVGPGICGGSGSCCVSLAKENWENPTKK